MHNTTEDPKPLSTGEALYQAILRNPHEDDVRLMYADYLEEQDTRRVPCPTCGHWSDDTRDRNSVVGIRCCTGSVIDTSAADRAEFIRVQCELEPIRNVVKYGEELHEKVWLELRERDILARHRAAWSKCVCPPSPFGCEGTGWAYGAPRNCKVCGGTGDLLLGRGDHIEHRPRPVEFRRGFVDGVGCTLAEAGAEWDVLCEECDNGIVRANVHEPFVCPVCLSRGTVHRWVPTPWARELVRALPVTRLVPADKKPLKDNTYRNWQRSWDWVLERQTADPNTLPRPVFDQVRELFPDSSREWGAIAVDQATKDNPIYLEFRTREAAADALAVAIATLVRTYVWGNNDDQS